MTTAEAARVLGVSERRVRQLADSGRLPHFRLPNMRLFDPAALQRLRKERRAGQL